MALVATKGEIPKNAVPLSRIDALEYQWIQIRDWPNKADVWPFRWGIWGLSTIAAVTGMYINGRYRRKLKLDKYGYISTSVPLIVLPGLFATAFHSQVITHDVFLSKTKCSLCLEYKAALLQIGSAIVYPCIAAPLANFLFALRYATYRVPHWANLSESLGLWWKFTKPLGPSLLVLTCVQAVAAISLTYYEAKKLHELRMRVPEMRRQAAIDREEKNLIKQSQK